MNDPTPARVACALVLCLCVALTPSLSAQEGRRPGQPDGQEPGGFPPSWGPQSGPGFIGRGPGMMGRQREILKEYDKNGDHRLDRAERDAARAGLKNAPGGFPGGPPGAEPGPGGGPGRGRGGFPGMPGMRTEPSAPGKKVAPADVPTYPNADFYDATVVRTLFLDFEASDWESELADFYHTDVDVPAQLTVDGKVYPGVGIGFRGASSYFAVPAGSKRSLSVAIDHTDSKLRLMGYKSLNLLNSHEDASFLHTVLYLQIARKYTPAPKANFVRLVINGENWGIYTNAQQFDKDLLEQNYKTDKGWRWKVQGSPNGQGGLEYLGEDIARYKQRYSLKSSGPDGDKAWRALVGLCYYLNETEPEHLVAALAPVLDIDSALWFLALEVVLVNNDGYWTRASDYSMFTDAKGKFHILPHDANETFAMNAGGPGGMGGPGGFGGRGMGAGPGRSGIELHPLVGLDERRKPLRSKLLQVPELRTKYLAYVKRIATEALDWNTLGPVVAQYRALLATHVKEDSKKLSSFEAFLVSTADRSAESLAEQTAPPAAGQRRRPEASLREFVEARRSWLLALPELQ